VTLNTSNSVFTSTRQCQSAYEILNAKFHPFQKYDWGPTFKQELIRRWDSERELLRRAPRKLLEFAKI